MKQTSIPFWVDRECDVSFGALQANLSFDVAIIGGGIVGLHTALHLRETGLKVAVIEALQIGRQATGRSTAKVTSQHGLKYASLIRDYGRAGAKLYADANETAKDEIAGLCSAIPGGANLKGRAAFIYSENEEETQTLREEANAAASLGLPAEFLPAPDLPVPSAGALRFSSQYQFDPYLYLCGVARLVSGNGTAVFEHSRVVEVVGDGPFELKLDGGVVTARMVVVTTQMPIVGDGLFFAKAFPFAHPVAAAPMRDHLPIDGMYINAGTPSHSFRTATKEDKEYLVVAGGEFKTGDQKGANDAIADMLSFLERAFHVGELTHVWINEDFQAIDGIAFVGPVSASKPDMLVATGFEAWGITQGVVAANILASHILKRPHPAAELFDATRIKPITGGPTFISENVKTAAHLVGERLLGTRTVGIDEIEPGSGGVIDRDGEKLAVTKAKDGTIAARSAICTHLGCVVDWNAVDRTWDCSCHGSRFDEKGGVLSGPATRPLEVRSPEATSSKA